MTIHVLETALPSRLGRSFRWLVASSWISNIGDGIIVAAGPLLVASETRDPLLVASAWTLEFLPMMLFGLFAGVVADRVERRRLIVVANSCRVAVLAGLVATIATGEVNIALVLAAIFVLGVGETFADTSTATLLPMLVAKRDLGIANARIIAGTVTLNQLVGPPIGALLFGLGHSLPFVTQTVCVAVEHPAGAADPASGARRAPGPDRGRSARTSARVWPGSGTTPPCARWC